MSTCTTLAGFCLYFFKYFSLGSLLDIGVIVYEVLNRFLIENVVVYNVEKIYIDMCTAIPINDICGNLQIMWNVLCTV